MVAGHFGHILGLKSSGLKIGVAKSMVKNWNGRNQGENVFHLVGGSTFQTRTFKFKVRPRTFQLKKLLLKCYYRGCLHYEDFGTRKSK